MEENWSSDLFGFKREKGYFVRRLRPISENRSSDDRSYRFQDERVETHDTNDSQIIQVRVRTNTSDIKNNSNTWNYITLSLFLYKDTSDLSCETFLNYFRSMIFLTTVWTLFFNCFQYQIHLGRESYKKIKGFRSVRHNFFV